MKKIIYILIGLSFFMAGSALAAPIISFQPTLLPIANNFYDLGTSTSVWRNLYVTQICLSADCRTVWPSGGGGGGSSAGPVNVLQASDGSGGFIATGTPQLTVGNIVGTTTAASSLLGNLTIGQLFKINSPSANPEFDLQVAGSAVAKAFYDVANTRFTFQNNNNNNPDALYFNDPSTFTGAAIFNTNATTTGSLGTSYLNFMTGGSATSAYVEQQTADDLVQLQRSGGSDNEFSEFDLEAPTINPQESTITTGLGSGTTRQFIDWTLENYTGLDNVGSINVAANSGASPTPFVIRFWPKSTIAHVHLIPFGNWFDPSGTVAFGYGSTTPSDTNRYDPTIQLQVSSSTAQTVFAVDSAARTHLFTVNQNNVTFATTTAGCASFGVTGILYSTGSGCGSGGGGGSGNVATSTHETQGFLAYWTSNSGTPALLGQVGTSTLTASSPLTGSFTQIGSGGSLGCQTASGSQAGCLSSTDWTTFNGKQAAGNYITALTGDVTASGPGSVAATLATVNGNVGSFTNATLTVNGKGLITAASNGATPLTSYDAWTHPAAGQSATTSLMLFNGNASSTGESANYAAFGSSATTTITRTGLIGVATTTPFAQLSVSDIGATAALVVGSSTATEFIVDQNGSVGVGTSSPAMPFSVNGTSYFNNTINEISSTNAAINQSRNAITNSANNVFRTAGTDEWALGLRNDSTNNFYLRDSVDSANLISGFQGVVPKIGIGATSTPFAQVSIEDEGNTNAFAVGSSTGNYFLIDKLGAITIGTTTAGCVNVSGSGVLFSATCGSGTVTAIGVTTNQGVSGSSSGGTTPNLTLTLGALTGVTSLNGLVVTANTGVITTGTWNGTTIDIAHGGTNSATTPALNSLLYYNGTSIVSTSSQALYTGSIFATSTSLNSIFRSNFIGIGTTTPQYELDISTSTKPQLVLEDGSASAPWSIRSVGGNLYFATTSPLTNATTSPSAMSVTGSGYPVFGVGTSSPFALISATNITGVATPLFALSSSTATGSTMPVVEVDKVGHVISSGPKPTLSSCGTTPTITGNDMSMQVTVGSVSATACTITFANAMPSAAYSILLTNESMSVVNALTIGSKTASGFTVSQTALTSDVLDIVIAPTQ